MPPQERTQPVPRKVMVRKTAYLLFFSDGNEATKTLQLSLEKFCENRTSRTERMDQLHKPMRCIAWKIYLIQKRI